MLTTLPMPSMSGTMYTRKPSSWGMGLARNWSSAEAGVWAGSAVARQSRAGSRAERTIIFPRGVGVAPVKSPLPGRKRQDRKSTRLNSSHHGNSYAVFCLKKKKLFFYIVILLRSEEHTSELKSRLHLV